MNGITCKNKVPTANTSQLEIQAYSYLPNDIIITHGLTLL